MHFSCTLQRVGGGGGGGGGRLAASAAARKKTGAAIRAKPFSRANPCSEGTDLFCRLFCLENVEKCVVHGCIHNAPNVT